MILDNPIALSDRERMKEAAMFERLSRACLSELDLTPEVRVDRLSIAAALCHMAGGVIASLPTEERCAIMAKCAGVFAEAAAPHD